MAGLFGIGGSSAHTDRKNQLTSWGDLTTLFNQQQKGGNYNLKTGMQDVNQAQDYWKALFSGDPTKMSAVLAPQISTIKGQSGQAIRGLEQFSGRSGGTSAAVNAENVGVQSAIQNLFDLLGPEAAQEFGNLAEFQTATGENQLNLAENAISTVGQQTGEARPGDQQLQQSQQAAVLTGLEALFLG